MSGKWTNIVGFGLVALCFVLSIGRIALRKAEQTVSDAVTIRFAHWQLESGVSEAFDSIAEEYMKLHPGVRVVQMRIPERVFPNWAITQLVGGTAPDLIEIGMGAEGERLGRYFVPLTQFIGHANPYNAGTDMEATPWRETFVDGLVGPPAFSEVLLEYYGIPSALHTIRVYYNVPLLKEITGSDQVPDTYEQFLELCEQVTRYSAETGRTILPIAGSKYNAPIFMNTLFGSQTQKLIQELQPVPLLTPVQEELWLAHVRGDVSLETPEIKLGLQLMHEVGQYMPPGFLQLGREDASFYFVQGRTLMIASGSWDSTSIRRQVRFEVDVFKPPVPSPAHPVYGQNVLGPSSEAGQRTHLAFGLTVHSKHPKEAVDFLRFMTSKQSAQKFSDISGWVSAVAGIELSPRTRGFEPLFEGYTRGVVLAATGETSRVVANNTHLLVAAGGSADRFIASTKAAYKEAVVADLQQRNRERDSSVRQFDSAIAGYEQLRMLQPERAGELATRLDALIEGQNLQELTSAFTRAEVRAAGHRMP